MSDSTHINTRRKPIGLENMQSNNRQVYHRGDTSLGAARFTPSSTPPPNKIKVHIKHSVTRTRDESPQKEAWWGMYNGSPQTSVDGSTSHSPTRLNFKYTTVPIEVFGYKSKDVSGTLATAHIKGKEKEKDKVAPTSAKTTSRWAWLRPAGPRIVKPAAVPTPAKARACINPPTVSCPSSPKKPIPPRPPCVPADATPKSQFESGSAQVTSLTIIVVKVCLVVYFLVGIHFVLNAIRQTVHALGAPFRGVNMIERWIWDTVMVGAKWAVWA
ncbi:hypothetical protein K504DRAFT_156735 [Pleomassaria siparia CBS 279.74]|uniref:Uncharacterized protein n=1 Tax=Pleomassaria siparia CBS 279.74 TaxID=1314801 RepID=A0A6G1KP19_9PLEO|nr:hypothetical protein K504DRAFT_156735 [Pleomassaria siparia CBS 279.74]